MSFGPLAKFPTAAFLLALLGVAILSCDTTSTTISASSVVSGRWAMDSIRMPDSATWTVHANQGTFSLGFPSDSSFSITDTLLAPLGTDTLVIEAWTLSLRTTVAKCWSDKAGNLTLYLPTTKDSLVIHLLLKLDSLRHVSSPTWGSRTQPKSVQIRSLIKAYTTLILAGDTTFSRFPARHPVGIDTLAVLDQLLIQAAATPMTAATLLHQLGILDTAKVHARARTLALAGQVDSLVLYPVISTSLVLSGVPYDLELVEDSLTKIPVTVSGLASDSATLHVVSSDTSILASFQRTIHTQDTLRVQAKPDAHGGPFKLSLTLSMGAINSATTTVFATVASRNDAPTFGGVPSLLVVSSATARSYVGWIDSISAGAANESSQSVTFQVQLESGAGLFSVAPSVDASGTLMFTGKSNSSGTAKIRVRAKDDGDSTGGNVDSSAWKETSLTFDVAPVLALPNRSVSTWEGIPVTVGTATVSDLETSSDNLMLSWVVSDSSLLPHDNVYVGISGSNRNIQLHPLAHRWGACSIIFSLADSQGVVVTDTMSLMVQAVNHAPTLGLSVPTVVRSYKGAQRVGKVSWDDVDGAQRGRVEVSWNNVSDSACARFDVDGTGVVFVHPKMDTVLGLKVRIRARDSAGTPHGGVDSSDWTAVSIPLADTVLDADGNSYRAKAMPDGDVWMRSNLSSTPMHGQRLWADSTHRCGYSYSWSQAMALDSMCDTASCKVSFPWQGLCPNGWHVADSAEWVVLIASTGIEHLRSGSEWSIQTNLASGASGMTYKIGDDDARFDLYPAQLWSETITSSTTWISRSYFHGAAFWSPNGMGLILNDWLRWSFTSYAYLSTGASVRCVSDD